MEIIDFVLCRITDVLLLLCKSQSTQECRQTISALKITCFVVQFINDFIDLSFQVHLLGFYFSA